MIFFCFYDLSSIQQFVDKTVRDLRNRWEGAFNNLFVNNPNQEHKYIANFPAPHDEYFESHQSSNTNIKMENCDNELRTTKEKLTMCEMNLKSKDKKIEEMAKEIDILQRKREKKNIDMKMLMYEKKQLELTLSGNRVKKKIRVEKIEIP